ncbi:MAG: putative aconitase with swiveling domain [Gammaproteobacteria bacterium]|jgi:predicted aconitase with swiveling domain
MRKTISSNVLIAGDASGKALVLEEALSFWGGFDPIKGEIIDVHHPQYQALVGEKILFIPESRGSAGTPAGIAETLRNGSGPRAFVLASRDVNISVGVLIANQLYDMKTAVLEISLEQMKVIKPDSDISIDEAGNLSFDV